MRNISVETRDAALTKRNRELHHLRRMVGNYKRVLRQIEIRADSYAVCDPGACPECDLLIELRDLARLALGLPNTRMQADVFITCEKCGEYHSIYVPCKGGKQEPHAANA